MNAHFLRTLFFTLALLFIAAPADAYRIDQDKEGNFYKKLTPKEREELKERERDRDMRQNDRKKHRRDKIKSRKQRLEEWRQHEKDANARKQRKQREEILERHRQTKLAPSEQEKMPEPGSGLTNGLGVGKDDFAADPPGPPAEGPAHPPPAAAAPGAPE